MVVTNPNAIHFTNDIYTIFEHMNIWVKSTSSLNCDKANYIQFTAKNGSLTDMKTGYNNNH